MTDLSAASDTRLAVRIFAALLLTIVVLAAIVVIFGLPALGIIGIIATIAVFAGLLAITAGN